MIMDLQKGTANVWRSIDQSNKPVITVMIWMRRIISMLNSRLFWKTKICAIAARLVPSLNGGSDRAYRYRQVQCFRVSSFMCLLFFKYYELLFGEIKLLVGFIVCRVLSQKGTSSDEILVFRNAIFIAKGRDVLDKLMFWNIGQWVFNSKGTD